MPFSLNSVTPGIAMELTECEASPAPFEQLAYLRSPCFWQAFYKHLARKAEATRLQQGSSVKACFSPGECQLSSGSVSKSCLP